MVLRNPDMGVYSELEINGSIKAHANTSDIGAYHSYKQVKFVLATCNSTPMEKDLLCCCCVLHKHRKKGRPCHWFLHPKGVVCSVTVWSPPSPSSAFSQVNLRAFCHCNPLWTPPLKLGWMRPSTSGILAHWGKKQDTGSTGIIWIYLDIEGTQTVC